MEVQLKSSEKSVRKSSLVKNVIYETFDYIYQDCLVDCERTIEDGKVILKLTGNNTVTIIEVKENRKEVAV